jgi:hypothetical protein
MQNQIQQSKIAPFKFVREDFEYELGALWVRIMVEFKLHWIHFWHLHFLTMLTRFTTCWH